MQTTRLYLLQYLLLVRIRFVRLLTLFFLSNLAVYLNTGYSCIQIPTVSLKQFKIFFAVCWYKYRRKKVKERTKMIWGQSFVFNTNWMEIIFTCSVGEGRSASAATARAFWSLETPPASTISPPSTLSGSSWVAFKTKTHRKMDRKSPA